MAHPFPQIVHVNYLMKPPAIERRLTAWQAWWDGHEYWDGDLRYDDLAVAQQHTANAYIGEEYSWTPSDDPDDEAPTVDLVWLFNEGRWHLHDNGQHTGVQLYQAHTYGLKGKRPDV